MSLLKHHQKFVKSAYNKYLLDFFGFLYNICYSQITFKLSKVLNYASSTRNEEVQPHPTTLESHPPRTQAR
jgi:hypothetical protein